MPSSGVESWKVVEPDGRPVELVGEFLAWLTRIERSPNTVEAYARDLAFFRTQPPPSPPSSTPGADNAKRSRPHHRLPRGDLAPPPTDRLTKPRFGRFVHPQRI